VRWTTSSVPACKGKASSVLRWRGFSRSGTTPVPRRTNLGTVKLAGAARALHATRATNLTEIYLFRNGTWWRGAPPHAFGVVREEASELLRVHGENGGPEFGSATSEWRTRLAAEFGRSRWAVTWEPNHMRPGPTRKVSSSNAKSR
jgi:hypothetical protein